MRRRSVSPARSKRDSREAREPEAASASHGDAYFRIYAIVKKISHGKVATYGQIAALAGMPRHARQVGYALHRLPEYSAVPWHRVIGAKGEISPRVWSENHLLQRILLEDEGVTFDERGRISLTRFGWTPGKLLA